MLYPPPLKCWKVGLQWGQGRDQAPSLQLSVWSPGGAMELLGCRHRTST